MLVSNTATVPRTPQIRTLVVIHRALPKVSGLRVGTAASINSPIQGRLSMGSSSYRGCTTCGWFDPILIMAGSLGSWRNARFSGKRTFKMLEN